MPIGAIIGAGASLIGANKSANAARDGAAVQADAAVRSAQIQADASDRASQRVLDQYNQTRDDLSVYRDVGKRGIESYMRESNVPQEVYAPIDVPDFSLQAQSEGFEESPGYQYMLDQGQKAIQNSASARGNLHSGETQLELMRHAQGLANQDYWNYVNANSQGNMTNYNLNEAANQNRYNSRLASRQDRLSRLETLANMGGQAAMQTGQFGANAANQAGQFGVNSATNSGNMMMQGAQAQAGGIAGAANAFNKGLTGAGNSIMDYQLMNMALGKNNSGQGGGLFSGLFGDA